MIKSLNIQENIWLKAKKKAKKIGMSLSAVITMLINEWLKDK